MPWAICTLTAPQAWHRIAMLKITWMEHGVTHCPRYNLRSFGSRWWFTFR
ncbi:MAG: hypothetical protein MUD01_09140 [Chloroflexaceae bacterium]|nr:hypothetical protein [Chloroflexaceae bacterium]